MIQSKPVVAVIENESDLRENIVHFLLAQGYSAWGASSLEMFCAHGEMHQAQVVLLDVGAPGKDGISFLSDAIARGKPYGIIMLTAVGSVDERVEGLVAGADAYLLKPFDFRELSACIDAVWRRLRTFVLFDMPVWELQEDKWILLAPDHRELKLTAKEYHFVRRLVQARGQAVLKSDIVQALGGHAQFSPFHRVESLVTRLRKKAFLALKCPLPLRAVPTVGFMFTETCRIVRSV